MIIPFPSRPRAATTAATFLSEATPRFTTLWRAVMRQECPPEMKQLFEALLSPWGDRPIPSSPQWPSDIGDDHTPYEFSLAIGGSLPELRVLVEAQADHPTPQAHWDAGITLTEQLARDYGVHVAQFDKVIDLFYPTVHEAQFAIWHAVCLYADHAPKWKLYLNPQARGIDNAGEVVAEALGRLGYPHAWRALRRLGGHRGPELDEVKYISLDLCARPDARVKVYFRHHKAEASDVERSFLLAKTHIPGDVLEFCHAMMNGHGPFMDKPLGSSFAYVKGDTERPTRATLHLPVARYVASDAVVQDRVAAYLKNHGIPTDSYLNPLTAFANRRLKDGVGMHSYASLQRERGKPRVTVYLSPEVFHVEPAVGERAPMRKEPGRLFPGKPWR